ncbi:MAG TPA: cysteine--tRNA ligase [Terriglobia bacterium]|nr:cysteine--tRNA ligase [Terriglobia bacterium]
MALRFYNTLAGRVEEFQPIEDKKVRIYTCGLTVYGYAHIGNYRTFVFQDILRRFLKYEGYEVIQVMNLTDVDDKTIRNAKAAGMSLREYTDQYIEAFEVDRQLLNLERPEYVVRATDHIDDMVKLVQTLEQRGYAYRSDGSYYFRVDKFPDYGKLSKIDLSGIRAGARVDADEYDKADVRDFVLWKAAKEGEPYWETPLGRGRPGWHIECSVMSMKYLGETFDIHSGGVDLAFPHHENEIAQSEAATGKPFVRYWLHCEHLVVNGQKMSKSLGNVYTLRDLIAKGYRPTAIRYLLASVPFRRLLNFTFDGLHQARQSVERLRNFQYRLTKEAFPPGNSSELEEVAVKARKEFEAALEDNLNTAEALAAIFEMVRIGNTAMDQGKFCDGDRGAFLDTLARWDKIFAVLEDNDQAKLHQLGLIKGVEEAVAKETAGAGGEGGKALLEALSDEEIERRLKQREDARRRGDFKLADQIRNELQSAGVLVEDTKAGTRWKRI